MTPSMRLSEILRHYLNHPYGKMIVADLDEAFSLGHEFGLMRAADFMDQHRGYAGIVASKQLRALEVVRVRPAESQSESFL